MTSTVLAAEEGGIQVGVHHQWHLLGMTFNADTIISTVIAALIILAIAGYLAWRATSGVPSGLQIAFETITDQIEQQVEDQIGVRTAPFVVPLAITLFVFILIANWISILPHAWEDYIRPPTADVNLTFAMAFFVILLVHITGVRIRGAKRYFGHFLQPYPALLPLEILTEIAKPITLSLRLFGNLFAGGVMVAVLTLLPAFVEWLPIIAWKTFDLAIGVIQAFIFALLTIIYFGFAVSHDEAEAH